jgi:HK97 family phage major capsid protein
MYDFQMPQKNTKMVRQMDMKDMKVDAEKRSVTFPFSSEYPVDQWFGKEILSHAPGACDLSRMNGGANALFCHDGDDYVGVVEKAWTGEDKRNYCEVRFSKSEFPDQIFKDVIDGIIRNVSTGYSIDELVLSKRGENGENSEYTVTKWTPFEVSFLTIPADPTVGVGRSEKVESLVTRALEVFESKNKPAGHVPALRGDIGMDDVEKKRLEAEAQAEKLKGERDLAVKAERERTKGITALCEKHGMSDLCRELLDNGRSIEEARAAVLEKIGAKQKPVTGNEAEIGLTDKEVRQFSYLNLIRAQMDPNDRRTQEAASFEREVSMAAQKQTGKAARGFLIPFDVLRQPLTTDGKTARRDLSVGTSTAGGDLVATNLLAASFIELLRNRSVVQAAGAQMLTGLVGNIAIPRMTGAATAYWVDEAVDTTESDEAFDQVTASPKSVGAMNQYSRKLMLQSSLDVEALVRNDIGMVIGLELDRVALYGSGSASQPLGLKGTSGINTSDFAADIPTWAEIVGLESKVNAANADIGAMKYLMGATSRGNLKLTPKIGSTYPIFMMDDNGKVNGYDSLMSNQVALNDYLFGVWNQLIMCFWSGLDILVDPYSNSKSGSIRVVAHQDVDIVVRHPASFTRGNNTL